MGDASHQAVKVGLKATFALVVRVLGDHMKLLRSSSYDAQI